MIDYYCRACGYRLVQTEGAICGECEIMEAADIEADRQLDERKLGDRR